MITAACPSCGGKIEFRSKSSAFCVCSYCRSNVVRTDVDLEAIGKQADLMPDMSPLQIGVTGIFKRRKFQVVGRQIMKWSDGRWNEWYIIFSDGTPGWLTEAQGEFIVLKKVQDSIFEKLPAGNLNHVIKYKKDEFTLIDRKKIVCEGSEGELPFRATPGVSSTVYDFSDGKEGFMSIERSVSDGDLVHIGEFVQLRKLKLVGYRRFEGWSYRAN